MSNVVFLPQGLHPRRAKMLGLASGPVEVLPYGQIRGVNINDGVFYLHSKAEAKPVLSRAGRLREFLPGVCRRFGAAVYSLKHS